MTEYRSIWFDEQQGSVFLADYFQRLGSWQRAIADGEITPEEVRTQSDTVITLLKDVETMVTPEQKSELTTIFQELAVLQAMQMTALSSTLFPGRTL